MSKRLAVFLLIISLETTCLLPIQSPAQANSTIFVPDDYSAVSSAIENAKDGDTIFIRAGNHLGAPKNNSLIIDKSISLIGENANTTTISLFPNYTVWWLGATDYTTYSPSIIINAPNVRIINLTLAPYRGGEILVNGNYTQVKDCSVTSGITVNTPYNVFIRDFIRGNFVLENSSFNLVSNSNLPFIHMNYVNSSIISNNTVSVLWLGYDIPSCFYNIFTGNVFDKNDYNHRCGIHTWCTNNTFIGNTIKNFDVYAGINESGITFGNYNAINNVFFHNNFINNRNSVSSYGIRNSWDNAKEGNYWSDYLGTDTNKDGIGDVPYTLDSENIDHFPLMEPFNISKVSIELPDWATSLIESATYQPTQTPSPSSALNPTVSPSPSIPELHAWIILSILPIITLVVYTIARRKILNKSSEI